jgi:hypothetical protein
MNVKKHNFELVYDPRTKTWGIYDNGVAHSVFYDTREDAQNVVNGLTGGEEKKSMKEVGRFFKNWKRTVKDSKYASKDK